MRIIFSVFQSNQSNRVNLSNHKLVKQQLNGSLIAECEGHYRGENELSFLVRINGPEIIGKIMTLCKEFNQESYLVIHETTDEAEIIERGTGDVMHYGKWSEIAPVEVKNHDGYTKIKDNYYTILGQ